jgi:hypothetical protein
MFSSQFIESVLVICFYGIRAIPILSKIIVLVFEMH